MKMSIVARTTTKLVSPFLVTYAIYLMLYSTDAPGGGFQAGVVLAVAVVLLITSHGYKKVRKRFRKKVVGTFESAFGLAVVTLLLFVVALSLPPSNYYVVPFNVLVAVKVGSAFTLIFYTLTAFLERD
ncbi:MnhB domain-containing protein [Pyrococcus yayanosii]|uniref:Putative multisubunit Na+/H+ antiporter n=1 Tax=Pyrococcus yayanosii (strain CH1 / JCM 16557) TaxID=529709 RepID=F8AI89_PYRYC|nr:MnhB domain-containing protein [Pyrococcus yayanosii]AEH24322.1 putative multisubunit Na+/H+ antiporter [Pyrococcus yayanosii CH1]